MRLRKTLKRTAAATLALSMALSAAAPAVTAAYICDVSQGSVNITVDADGSKTIQVGGQKVEDDGDGTDDIIITGDNTQAPASQNDAAEPAPAETEDEEAPAEEDAAPADEAEAPETADAEGTEDAAADDADAEDAAAEPATLELDGKNELIGGIGAKNYGDVTAGLYSEDLDGTLTLTDADKDGGSLTAKGGYSKDYRFASSGGICAKDLSIIDTSITAVGGDVGGSSSCGGTGLSADVLNMTGSSLSATGGSVNNSTDDYSAGGFGLRIGNYRNLKSNISDSHISAIGGNNSGSGKEVEGGMGAIIIGTAADSYQIDHVTLLAQGGNAQASGSGNAEGGRGIDRNSGEITISDSAVTVAGGNAVSESGTATGGGGYYNNANYYSSEINDVHLVSGSLTAVGGSGSSKNGSSFDISSELIKNYYISDGETLSVYEPGDPEYNIARSDRLVVSEDSGIVYYNHSAVVQNEDGSVTVTGEPFRYVRGGHVYTIASRTATTIIWHCEDEGVEDLELPIPAGSTFDAMKHEWVTSEDGTYEECTICHLQRTIPQPEPDQPDTPSNDTTAAAVPAALHLRVVDANGADVTFETRTESGNYIVDARRDGLDTATLLAPLPVLRELQASGAESITFVTNLKTTTLSLSALLALGGEDDEAQLLHTGDVPTLTVGGTVHNELL